MAIRKKIWEMSRFDLGMGNFNIPGMSWFLQNIDINSKQPFVLPSRKLYEEINSGTSSFLDENMCATSFAGVNYSVAVASGKISRKKSTTGWEEVHDNSQVYGGLGLLGDSDMSTGTEKGKLYYASNAYAGLYDADADTWTDNWKAFKVSNAGNLCPIVKYQKFIVFGNKNYLGVWDIGASAWDDDRIILPTGYNVTWMKAITSYLVIVAYHETFGSMLFLWDGSSTTYNNAIPLGKVKALGGDVLNGTIYFIGNDGWVYSFDENGLTQLDQLPDFNNYTGVFSVHPGAVIFYKGLLHIGMSNSGDVSRRFTRAGVWTYNPKSRAFAMEYTLSGGSIYNKSITCLMVTPGTVSQILRVIWYNGTNYYIDANVDSSTFRKYPYGAIIVSPIFDSEPYRKKRFMQTVINLMEELPDSASARIIVRYNTSEKYYKYIRTVLSGNTNSFVMTGNNSIDVNVGDEVTIIDGTGAGQIRNILTKTLDSETGYYTFVVDEALSNSEEFSVTSILQVSEFKKVRTTIDGDDFPLITNKLLRYNVRAKKIQFKIELWTPSTSEAVGIANISNIYSPDKIIR